MRRYIVSLTIGIAFILLLQACCGFFTETDQELRSRVRNMVGAMMFEMHSDQFTCRFLPAPDVTTIICEKIK